MERLKADGHGFDFLRGKKIFLGFSVHDARKCHPPRKCWTGTGPVLLSTGARPCVVNGIAGTSKSLDLRQSLNSIGSGLNWTNQGDKISCGWTFWRSAVNTFLSSAQEAIKENYVAFTKEAIAPHAKALDSRTTCLKDFMQMLGQKGYLGIAVPKEYGGHGNPFTFCALFVEALANEEPGLGLSLAVHFSVIETIKKYGSETQKSRFLPLLARGEVLGTLAISEEKAGTDFTAVSSTLKKDGDSLVLDGKKLWVVNGQISGLALVLSKNVEAEADSLALSLVDCSHEAQACSKDGNKMMGLQSAYINTVEFKNTKFESANRFTGEKAELIASFAMDVAKTVLAAAAVGLTFGAMNKALEHARSREQFGKTIGQFQGIQWKLADMFTEGEGARLQVQRAAWSLEGEPKSFPTYAAMSKWYAAKVARQHSGEAMQILGAVGLMEDCPVEKFYRDAKAMEICLGTSEGQKLQLVQQLAI